MKTAHVVLRWSDAAASRWNRLGRSALAAIACAVAAASLSAQPQPSRPRTVLGKAISTDGAPVPNVKVTLTATRGWAGGGWNFDVVGRWTAVSGADGAFRIELPSLIALQFTYQAEPPPDAPVAFAAQFSCGSPPQEIILFAPATAKLTGTVRDDAGQPVPGAVVALQMGFWNWFARTATTNEQGVYEFPHLAPGRYRISSVEPPSGASCTGLHTWKPTFPPASPQLTEGQASVKDFTLSRGARFIGRVLDENGKPVAGARVSCGLESASETAQAYGPWHGTQATTDAEGRYVLGAVAPETCRVEAVAPEGSGLASAVLRGLNAAKPGDIALQDLRLYKGAALVGEVVDADEKPLPGAEASVPGNASQHAKTDAHGRFVLRGLTPDTCEVTIAPPDGSDMSPDTFKGVPLIGGFEIAHRFMLQAARSVSGKVTGPDGQPLAHVKVSASWGRYGPSAGAVTDEQGAYAIHGLPRNPPVFTDRAGRVLTGRQFLVSAAPSGEIPCCLPRTVELPDAPHGTPVNIQLPPAAALTGRVTGPEGKPLADCIVCAYQSPNPRARRTHGDARTTADGLYVVGQIEPGAWGVSVEPPPEVKLQGESTPQHPLQPGKPEVVDVQLLRPAAQRTGAVVAGRVLLDGKPFIGAQLTMRAAYGTPPRPVGNPTDAWSGPGGEFRFDSVQPGTYQIACTPFDPGLRGDPANLTVTGAAEYRVDLPVVRAANPESKPR